VERTNALIVAHFLAGIISKRTYSVFPYRGRNYKCLRVVDTERFKRVRRTFHYRFFPLHEVQDIYCTPRIVGHAFREPMAVSPDEDRFGPGQPKQE
jgi:hypothetical protein